VSHNRSFVNGLATQVWEVKDLGIDAQPGDLDDWERRRAAALDLGTAQRAAEPTRDARPPSEHSKEARRERAALREKRSQALGPLRRKVAELEDRISTLEAETKRSEAALADPAVFADAARATTLVTSYRAAQATLTELYSLWESAQEELSSAEAQLDRSG
jgi:ATP-binding cassette subfamily F protein 3